MRVAVLMMSVVLAVCGGCSSRPEPKLYLLSDGQEGVAVLTASTLVGLGDIALPAYARQQDIAFVSGDLRVERTDEHRWAVPPAEAISAALSRALEHDLRGPVAPRPYPRGYNPDIQVQVSFDRFLMGPDGQAELQGQYIIVGRERSARQHTQRFQLAVPANGPGYAGFMGAMERGLGQLAVLIGADIREHFPFE